MVRMLGRLMSRRRPTSALSDVQVERIARSTSSQGVSDTQYAGRLVSAPSRKGVAAERKLKFRTAAEIEEETPVEPEWIAKPWVAVGAVTTVDGKPKAAEKTTWINRLIGCALDGTPFMDEPTSRTPVVYLTEEGGATFRQALQRAGLLV